ncbi:serine hydrolase [Streptomyces virginiae]|uniref:serine hydrolase n=1 Tax=Streptomyces virginiae TaxID=1961 RepID=UPI00224FC2D2|nr:serine hydrolase [Streptomyces virginiae]MCX4717329.1 beta-lactamase family protein [Streptomyces virginiae]MCX5277179.1 beta-lactamase family protein [Streptomyces virginiae]
MMPLCDQATAVRALVESTDPGAVWAVGGPEGPHAGSDGEHPADTAFDMDGLAAVLALWPALGSLVDEGVLSLHTPLAAYGEPAAEGTPAGTTAHHLLTHPGGTAHLTHLTRLVEHLSGSPLADLVTTRVWHPLGMTGTGYTDGTLHAPLADLVRFLCHLLPPADPAAPTGISRTWTTESLRIRTGELTPARGLLWDPAPHGVWTHHAPKDAGPTLWISPRHHRWALLLPTAGRGMSRTAFREAAFTPTAPE